MFQYLSKIVFLEFCSNFVSVLTFCLNNLKSVNKDRILNFFKILREQMSALPLNREQRSALPLNREQRSALPLNREQRSALPLNREQRSALPLNREQRSALPLNREQRSTLPLNRGKARRPRPAVWKDLLFQQFPPLLSIQYMAKILTIFNQNKFIVYFIEGQVRLGQFQCASAKMGV